MVSLKEITVSATRCISKFPYDSKNCFCWGFYNSCSFLSEFDCESVPTVIQMLK